VVRVRAVAVKAADAMPRFAYRLILPWLTFPAVVGADLAGEIAEVGILVRRLRPGDRVLGHAVGLERNRNRAAEGAFQEYAVLLEHMVSPIPDDLSFEQAAVLPFTLSTAATGLFQADHLGLTLPTIDSKDRDETVLVWGGSTSVGSNAIQLAHGAGYRVVATASPHNLGYVRSLGAAAAVDYHRRDAVEQVVEAIGRRPFTGTLAIGSGSLPQTLKIASRVRGWRRIAIAESALTGYAQLMLRRRHGDPREHHLGRYAERQYDRSQHLRRLSARRAGGEDVPDGTGGGRRRGRLGPDPRRPGPGPPRRLGE
jgi:threonine dehydrogenase-like Zn-dependent dehydrogenase